MSDEANGGVKSAARALMLLETVSSYPDGATFTDLGARMQLPKSSLHGLLKTLVDLHWLSFDPESRRYLIGVRPWEVGQAFLKSRELVVRTRQFLLAAHQELGETVQLAILDDLDVVYIDKVEGTNPLRLVSRVGSRLPAYVTGIGKAMLADLPDDVLKERYAGVELPRHTAQTVTSGDELIRILTEVRKNGFAEDDGEYTLGVYCVGVPIRDGSGRAVAAMSCSVPKARLESGEFTTDRLRDVLSRAAVNASLAIGDTRSR